MYGKKIIGLILWLNFFIATDAKFIQSLHSLSNTLVSLHNMLTPQRITYEKLQEIVDSAYENNDISIFDQYPQTLIITTAKHLFEMTQKNELDINRNEYKYIPFMAIIAQEISLKYPHFDKNSSFNIVSLGSGDVLDKEFLLIRMLRSFGYKKIYLVAIDLIYDDTVNYIKARDLIFGWSQNEKYGKFYIERKIDQAQPENGVKLVLQKNVEEYIKNFNNKKIGRFNIELPQNHLFVMIQPGSIGKLTSPPTDMLTALDMIPLNTFGVEKNNKSIEWFFPYKKSEYFQITKPLNENILLQPSVDFIENYIKTNIKDTESVPDILKNLFKEKNLAAQINNLRKKNNKFFISNTVFLDFIDLIKFTAHDPLQPLAFEILDLHLKKIFDTSGTHEKIFERYKN